MPWVFCRSAGIDAALVRVQFVLRGCVRHRNKIEFKIQNTKVAFDVVRLALSSTLTGDKAMGDERREVLEQFGERLRGNTIRGNRPERF